MLGLRPESRAVSEARAETIRQKNNRKQERAQRRNNRADRRSAAWRTCSEAVRQFIRDLPARAVIVPAGLAVATAWTGQYQWAVSSAAAGGLGWDPVLSAALATALECLGLSLAALARNARDAGDSAVIERVAMWGIVAAAATANYHHNGPVLALMSILSVVGWELYERRRYRVRLAEHGRLGRPERRPRFGLARWVRYPRWTFRAWSISVRDRLGPGDAVAALDRAAAERSAAAPFRFRPLVRRAWRKQTARLVEHRQATEVEQARQIIREATDATRSAALLFGPNELRGAAEATDDRTTGNQPAETAEPAEPAETAEPTETAGRQSAGRDRRRWFRRRPKAADRNTTGAAADMADREAAAAEPSEPTGSQSSAPAEHQAADDRRTPLRPVPTGDRKSASEPTETTDRETADVDVSDLLPAAREVAAELGDRLSRDRLTDALRDRGHSVGGRRRTAVYEAVRNDTATVA